MSNVYLSRGAIYLNPDLDTTAIEMNSEPDPEEEEIVPLKKIFAAVENSQIYAAISNDSLRDLVRSIREHGILDPIIVSSDGVIITGHRRYRAAQILGLPRVPVRVRTDISYARNRKEFIKLLIEYNSQRIKDPNTLLKEAMIKIDPAKAHRKIIRDRKRKQERDIGLTEIKRFDVKPRSILSWRKMPLLRAIQEIVERYREHWPLSVRQIHYLLLGPNAPLTNASLPWSQYENTLDCYQQHAVDVCSRGRLEGYIPWEAIDDSTRQTDVNRAFMSLEEFFQNEMENFLDGYWRNKLQSQPHHIEIIVEKRTLHGILSRIAHEHTMPLTIMGGMNTLTQKKKVYERYRQSKRDRLVILAISDLDVAGDIIAENLYTSFTDDFSIFGQRLKVYKVALTFEQAQRFNLPPSAKVKETKESGKRTPYTDKYGTDNTWELDALPPDELVKLLNQAIEQVIDTDLYNQQIQSETDDSVKLIAIQNQCAKFFKSLKLSSKPPA